MTKKPESRFARFVNKITNAVSWFARVIRRYGSGIVRYSGRTTWMVAKCLDPETDFSILIATEAVALGLDASIAWWRFFQLLYKYCCGPNSDGWCEHGQCKPLLDTEKGSLEISYKMSKVSLCKELPSSILELVILFRGPSLNNTALIIAFALEQVHQPVEFLKDIGDIFYSIKSFKPYNGYWKKIYDYFEKDFIESRGICSWFWKIYNTFVDRIFSIPKDALFYFGLIRLSKNYVPKELFIPSIILHIMHGTGQVVELVINKKCLCKKTRITNEEFRILLIKRRFGQVITREEIALLNANDLVSLNGVQVIPTLNKSEWSNADVELYNSLPQDCCGKSITFFKKLPEHYRNLKTEVNDGAEVYRNVGDPDHDADLATYFLPVGNQ